MLPTCYCYAMHAIGNVAPPPTFPPLPTEQQATYEQLDLSPRA